MNSDRHNLLAGAAAIAGHFYGDRSKARSIYKLMANVNEPHRFPMFYLGRTLCARKTDIDAWIEASIQAANRRGGHNRAA